MDETVHASAAIAMKIMDFILMITCLSCVAKGVAFLAMIRGFAQCGCRITKVSTRRKSPINLMTF
jgi:hypothetical protein